ncbi:hypothetical protein Cgig2_024065 [Carnegiea gigantea]|uniref:Uncharacterized protein n=1 Tax=Carnegiea gigantea TaxID=171969 RepID=A0A9Q1Q9V9_9CARY|nr:hypothetical protein Cgig2_024065 [Carnegiea gigantea]
MLLKPESHSVSKQLGCPMLILRHFLEINGANNFPFIQPLNIMLRRDGDRNTQFYYLSTIVRRRVNCIEALQDVSMSRSTFKYISYHMEKELLVSKAKVLSMAGSTTLMQSAISSIPYYSMQTASLICDDIDKKSRDHVTQSKEAGGLGFRSMRQVNRAFLMKLGWGLLT